MTHEPDTKPCSYVGCDGEMTFSPQAMPPSERAGSAEATRLVASREPQPAWLCDRSRAHFEPVWASSTNSARPPIPVKYL
jgi:hypothetical protein